MVQQYSGGSFSLYLLVKSVSPLPPLGLFSFHGTIFIGAIYEYKWKIFLKARMFLEWFSFFSDHFRVHMTMPHINHADRYLFLSENLTMG